MEFLINLLDAIHPVEKFAVLFGLIYVVLAARESVWCWFWGILSCSLWAWATYNLYNLKIDALLQIFYVGVSFFGIWQWLKGGQQDKGLKISKLSAESHSVIIAGGLVLSAIVGYLFAEYTEAASTYLDAFTTVFSIIATFMVVRKILENWMYWVVIDICYVYLYYSRDSVLFTGLMVIYTLIAIFGWMKWQRKYEVVSKATKNF